MIPLIIEVDYAVYIKQNEGVIFSFHYPKGWEVSSSESIVAVENSKSDEQLVMAMIQ